MTTYVNAIFTSNSNNNAVVNNIPFDIDVDELSEECPRMVCPVATNIVLKPHQQTLLHRCVQYENVSLPLRQFSKLAKLDPQDYLKTNVAVLGDRVGSGKSYVILSLIVSNDITNKNVTTIKSHGLSKVMFYLHDRTSSIKTNLLVVPHNLSNQWEYYVSSFGGNIKYKVVKTQKVLDALMSTEAIECSNQASTSAAPSTASKTFIDKLSEFDLIIITSTLYNRFANKFNEFHDAKLQRVIYDEVDNLSIPGCKPIDANFTWFVTASYGNVIYPKGFVRHERSINKFVWYAEGLRHSGFLKNILMDLWYNVPVSWIKTLVIKNKEGFVEKSLSLPEMRSHYIKCRTPYTINVLNGIVDRNILNHLNADDIQGALAYVNPNNKTSEDNIIKKVIDKYTRQAENIMVNIRMANEYLYDTEEEKQAELARLQRNHDAIAKKISMITERIKNNDMCAICYDNTNNKTITQCCQNSFCFKCINLWLTQKKACPMCKCTLDITGLFVVQEGQEAAEEPHDDDIDDFDPTLPNEKNDKYENLELILAKINSNAKVLIFSAFESSFNNITPRLAKLKISYDYLKGNGNQIQATINKYKNGDCKVLLINTKNYGSGLNLENTTDMILFHKFDNEIEKQVIGRAQRFGRKEALNVHYLLYENEFSSTSTS